MPSIIAGVDEMHPEPWQEDHVLYLTLWRVRGAVGVTYMYYVCVYMYIYIVCIIHKACQNFNLTLNLRLTVFHSIFSAITCMIAFSGGLSPLPLMAILQPEIRLVDSSICFSSLLIPLKGCWRGVFFFPMVE